MDIELPPPRPRRVWPVMERSLPPEAACLSGSTHLLRSSIFFFFFFYRQETEHLDAKPVRGRQTWVQILLPHFLIPGVPPAGDVAELSSPGSRMLASVLSGPAEETQKIAARRNRSASVPPARQRHVRVWQPFCDVEDTSQLSQGPQPSGWSTSWPGSGQHPERVSVDE